jgi:hypothetical protein
MKRRRLRSDLRRLDVRSAMIRLARNRQEMQNG